MKIQEFNKLGILVKYYNSSKMWIQLPNICGTLLFLSLLCIFGTIRLNGHVTLLQILPFAMISCICFPLLIVILYIASIVYSESKSILLSFKSESVGLRNSLLLSRQLRCLKSYGIEIGLVKSVKKISVVYTFIIVCNNLASLLVTFPG